MQNNLALAGILLPDVGSSGAARAAAFNKPVILSERSESKDLPDYGAPIACQRQNRMSFRAADRRRGILPVAVWLRIYPAPEIDERLPQSADPSAALRVTRVFVFAGTQSVRRNR